jgi:hypothetical protein
MYPEAFTVQEAIHTTSLNSLSSRDMQIFTGIEVNALWNELPPVLAEETHIPNLCLACKYCQTPQASYMHQL